MSYTAKNIKIRNVKFDPMYDWELAGELAEKYVKPIAWIKRGIESCRLSGISPEYFIDKYLRHKTIETNPDVSENIRKILLRDRS